MINIPEPHAATHGREKGQKRNVHRMSEELCRKWGPQDPHANPHQGEALRLSGVREDVHAAGPPDGAHESPHG